MRIDERAHRLVQTLKRELCIHVKGDVDGWVNYNTGDIEIRIFQAGMYYGMSISENMFMYEEHLVPYILMKYRKEINDKFFKN